MLTTYDKARLRKWTNILAGEISARKPGIDAFGKAVASMIKDSYRLSLDIGGATPKEIEKFLTTEYK